MSVIPFAEWRPDMPSLSQWAREHYDAIKTPTVSATVGEADTHDTTEAPTVSANSPEVGTASTSSSSSLIDGCVDGYFADTVGISPAVSGVSTDFPASENGQNGAIDNPEAALASACSYPDRHREHHH